MQALDWNGDGLIDFYSASRLYINQGNWKFKNIRQSVGLPELFDEGFKIFDYNNDGLLDFLYMHPNYGPVLYVNHDGYFSKESPAFENGYCREAFGLNVADINGDSYEDVLAGGGYNESGGLAQPKLFVYQSGRYKSSGFVDGFYGWSDLVSVGV
ncbi:MAG: VCBS repeat-containing protein [Neisseriaceae bacterium]|nr:MAG: VCBS repeat-containing protein [Neisseriaceae bacterium]